MQSQKEHTASTQKGQAGFEPRTFILWTYTGPQHIATSKFIKKEATKY